jgi:hypothetical protein
MVVRSKEEGQRKRSVGDRKNTRKIKNLRALVQVVEWH